MTEPKRYFFVHLQKTAGTALFQRLQVQFERTSIYPLAQEAGTVAASLDVELLQRRFKEHRDELRVITGHFPLCVCDLLGVPFSTFTVLRDPVERTLSFLRDNQQRESRLRDTPLEDIYADPVLFPGLIENHMVKMLSLSVEEVLASGTMASIEFDTRRLEVAKRNLSERVDVVGLQEHFEEFCCELEQRFGFDLGAARFANRTKPVDVPSGLREVIARDNELDIELYRFAVQLREERLHAGSTRGTRLQQ